MGTTVPPDHVVTSGVEPAGPDESWSAHLVRDVGLIAAYLGAVKAACAASIEVPGSPVPISPQSMVVIGGGVALGPVRASVASLAHGVLSAAGVRGFASRGRATRGYVAGFLVAGPTVGYLAAQGRADHAAGAMGVAAIGHGVILAVGAAHLHRHDPGSVWKRGLRPFLPGAVIKSASVAVAAPLLRRAGARFASARAARSRSGQSRGGSNPPCSWPSAISAAVATTRSP